MSLALILSNLDSPNSMDTVEVQENSKSLFFKELQALQNDDSSGDEQDTNELKMLLLSMNHRFRPPPPPPLSSSLPSHSPSEAFQALLQNQKRSVVNPAKKMPAIHRATSAPVGSVRSITETPAPALQRKTSLLRHDISDDITPTTSFVTDKPPLERHNISTPTFGSVIMTNSVGIMNMLNNNSKKQPKETKNETRGGTKKASSKETKKRKSDSISMVSDAEQTLKGITFFYVPADDIHGGRKRRILKVREYGGVWAKEWTSSVGCVVVDDPDVTFDQTLKYLKNKFHVPEISPHVIFVNGDFPADCITYKKILEHDQTKYKVKGSTPEPDQNYVDTSLPKERRSVNRNRGDEPGASGSKEVSPQAYSPAFNFPDSQLNIGTKPYLVESPSEVGHDREVQYESLGEEFDELIKESKTMQDLPFDDDDLEDDRPSSSEGYGDYDSDSCGSEGERERKADAKKKKRTTGPAPTGTFNQAGFSCMKGGATVDLKSNPNRTTIKILQQMASYYERVKFNNNEWRAFSYKRAAGMLQKQTKKVSTYDEAIAITHIGHRLAAKIEEIARTNRLRRLDNALAEPDDHILQLFGGVYNVGASRAHAWVRDGYKTLEDLKQADRDGRIKLSFSQMIGIDHYEDFNTRIPRDEVTALGKLVQDAAAVLDSSIEIIISGSYRRGAPTSGDIDCMITKAGTTSTSGLLRFLDKLVKKLTNSEFLVAGLAVPDDRKDDGSKWHGACVLPSSEQKIWRRIDFLLVPASEFGAALIYFTGDDIFNRSLRLLAGKKGMRLNQRGLYKDVMRGQGRVKITEGTLVEGADEKRIFEVLGVPWREPHNRICH